jgi:hypothetical protein
MTPLYEAVSRKKPTNFQALLAAGADGKVKDNEGRTPWDVVQDNDNIIATDAYTALE